MLFYLQLSRERPSLFNLSPLSKSEGPYVKMYIS